MDGAKSAVRQGCLFARPTGAIYLKMPQTPKGLISRKKTFCFVFGLFKNEGPRQGHLKCSSARIQITRPQKNRLRRFIRYSLLVEAAGIEPASASTPPSALHA